jgi:O-antigen/teichoic acid export membrane protein
MWAACLIALGGTFFAPLIVSTTYGARYATAVLPFQVAIWMIPVAWFSGHFRFSLIASGHQRREFLACAAGGAVTIVSAYVGFGLVGTPGAAAALVLGGIANAALAGMAMYRVIGSVQLSSAAQPILSCAVAGVLGILVTLVSDKTLGAVVAVAFYAIRGASQWTFTRMKHAWEGRLT